MQVAELATKLNTTVEDILVKYRALSIKIPHDPAYFLSFDLIQKMIPDYRHSGGDGVNPTADQSSSSNMQLGDGSLVHPLQLAIDNAKLNMDKKRQKRLEILAAFQILFKSSEFELTQQFKQHNLIDSLLLSGQYRKVPNQNFGYLEDITTIENTRITYPVSNDSVGSIFIRSGELLDGKRYVFDAMLASMFEREKHSNPFLLQAKPNTVKEIVHLNALETEISAKEKRLDEIKEYLTTAEDELAEKEEQIEEKARSLIKEKQIEANEAIDGYNQKITHVFEQLQEKDRELKIINEAIKKSNSHILSMEKLISTIKDRLSLCRNLQFISEQEERTYLDLFLKKSFDTKGHLVFDRDLESDFSKLADHIHAYLFKEKHLIYTRYQIRNFLSLVKTHDIVVLTGLSGSGKTQIIKAFAQAIGGVAKIIPVKPNWTSSDDLLGYYNPIQMSFLPSPFTEAIVEAIHNPNQLYLICLDEMNLARAEYYFADFLSKLEERNQRPEIELYSNHEEELFISEFTSMLNLVESSINGQAISSWQQFLDNEEARTRFFEMLGQSDKESMLQLHSRLKRRLIDILKFPSTIKIPSNIRFIGAINVDETTHYFSPKILDRIHVVKFENPLFFEHQVKEWIDSREVGSQLMPIYVHPDFFSDRVEYPHVNLVKHAVLRDKLKEINKRFLLQMNIDFGIRSLRQGLNYSVAIAEVFKYYFYDFGRLDMPNASDHIVEDYELVGESTAYGIALNSIIIQKILPRFIFDGNEIGRNGKTKLEIAEELHNYLAEEFAAFYYEYETDEMSIGRSCVDYLKDLIESARRGNNAQVNFFA